MHIYATSFSLAFALYHRSLPCSFVRFCYVADACLSPQQTDLVFATAALLFLVQPSASPFIAFAVDAPLLPLRSARRSIVVFVLSARLFGLAAILCFAAARDLRSSFRQSLLFWPLPNLAISLDTAFLLLYNYLAFACVTFFFVFFRLCNEARRDRLADNRLRRRSPNTTK